MFNVGDVVFPKNEYREYFLSQGWNGTSPLTITSCYDYGYFKVSFYFLAYSHMFKPYIPLSKEEKVLKKINSLYKKYPHTAHWAIE